MSTVVDLTSRLPQGPSTAHPAAQPRTKATSAQVLTTLARSWDRILDELSVGPGQLSQDDALVVLYRMVQRYIHPGALEGLVFNVAQLLDTVRRHDAVRDGEVRWEDEGYASYDQALAKAADDVDWVLYPLLTGRSAMEACNACRRVCTSPELWQSRARCTEHKTGGR